jgi:hypothetical protein
MSFILPIQIIVLAFLAFAFSRVYLRVKSGQISWGMFFFWSLIWVMAILTTLKPEITSILAKKFGIGRGIDAAIYLSIVVLFYLVFRLHVYLEDLNHKITKLIREISLQEKK